MQRVALIGVEVEDTRSSNAGASSKSDHARWFVGKHQPNAKLRLYCFTHAGGQPTSYLPWQDALGPNVEVRALQLPGRAGRFAEPFLLNFSVLIDELQALISRQEKLPFVFFGHSLGALMAFETARALAKKNCPTPRHLIVSGCNAPSSTRCPRGLHLLDDDRLREELSELNGTPKEVLADRDLMALLMPMIRADFALLDDYQYTAGSRLQIPITVLFGEADKNAPHENMPDWALETSKGCEFMSFKGGHFFVETERREVISKLKDRLLYKQRGTAAEEN